MYTFHQESVLGSNTPGRMPPQPNIISGRVQNFQGEFNRMSSAASRLTFGILLTKLFSVKVLAAEGDAYGEAKSFVIG